jgi:mono/diheme cytochrome c family protein
VSPKPGDLAASFRFVATNVSDHEVMLNALRTSCGCTVAQLPSTPYRLAPGANVPIAVTLDLRGKSGTLTKTVSVESSAGVKSLIVRANLPQATAAPGAPVLTPGGSVLMPGVLVSRPRAAVATPNTPDAVAVAMAMGGRAMNIQSALADRQAIFKADCAKCHVEKGVGKMGAELYAASCGICHDAEHRAAMVPDLKVPRSPRNFAFWQKWITEGKPGTLMPAFAAVHGGPLTPEQVDSLTAYLYQHFPGKAQTIAGVLDPKTATLQRNEPRSLKNLTPVLVSTKSGSTKRSSFAASGEPLPPAVGPCDPGKVFWVDSLGTGIYSSDLDGANQHLVHSFPSGGGEDVAVNPVTGKIYFGDNSTLPGKVMGADSDGANPVVVTTTLPGGSSGGQVKDIAVGGGMVYWTDWLQGNIYRANLGGGAPVPLVNVNGLIGIELDLRPSVLKLYYFDNNGNIYRANLDGTGQEYLYSFAAGLDEIALDTCNDKIYVIGKTQPHPGVPAAYIRSANLIDGSGLTTLLSGGGPVGDWGDGEPVHLVLDLHNQRMYWTSANVNGHGQVKSADMVTGNNVTVVATSPGSSANYGIALCLADYSCPDLPPDCSNTPPSTTIYGTKWADLNGDGHREPNEPGLPNWTIHLMPGNLTATTDANGNYCFTNLAPGIYTLNEVLTGHPGWVQTFPTAPNTYTVTLPDDQGLPFDFGNTCVPTPCTAPVAGPRYSTWPVGLTLYGDAVLQSPIVKLTENINGQYGVALVPQFNGSTPIHSFRATFKLYIGGGTTADGFSFNLADDVPTAFIHEGVHEGIGTGLTVEFDTYDNLIVNTTGIFLKSGGPLTPRFGGTVFQPSQGPNALPPPLGSGVWYDVEITMDSCGYVTVFYNGQPRAGGQIAYVPGPNARFVLGAFTGALNDNHWVKDLVITTESSAPDITVNTLPGEFCAPVSYTPCFTDDCDPNLTIVCVPPSGSSFPVGTTRVSCTATDSAGNQAQYCFNVIVTSATPPVNRLLNPSFEMTLADTGFPLIPNYSDNSLDRTTGVPGWTTNPGDFLEVWTNTVGGIPASMGLNQLEINAQDGDETVFQTVTGLTPGCPVRFCFDYTGRFGIVGGTYNNDFTVTVSDSGGYSFSMPLDPPIYSVGGWQQFCRTFTPLGSKITIAFRGQPHHYDGTAFTQGGAHIDNVILTQSCCPSGSTTVLTSPFSGGVIGKVVFVDFTLLEVALAGSVALNFGAHQLVLANSQEMAGRHSFSFNPAAPTATSAIASGAAIPDGTYTVTLSYQNAAGNSTSTAVSTGVVLDTTPPVLTGPFTPVVFSAGTPLPDYAAQAVITDATMVTVTQLPLAGSATSAGDLSVEVKATDAAGNVATLSVPVMVRPLSAVSTGLFSKGDAAPGAGAPGGPPADAKLASFGVPATDDDGNVAFLAKWTSATGGSGSGLFTSTECVATVRGGVPALAGATFKTLSDPVAGGGHVAFLATVAGVPSAKAAAVFSGSPGPPAVIAQAGTVAPGSDALPLAGGPTFKSFKAVAVDGGSVAIQAQLTGGTGVGRVTPASDSGLWLKDATHGLTLVLRKGQTIGNRTITTLVAFAVGNGSPGQGRGWLTQPQAGGPKVLALAMLSGTDHKQAVLSADLTGGVSVLSETGPGGTGGPDVNGASFASYGVPAANHAGNSAFLGSLKPGGAVKTSNARGIFVDYGDATYTSIARLTDLAGTTGASFIVLKDPVLADDDGVAFSATLKGGTVKGLAATTIWWKPAGGALTLLAQGGARPGNDLPPAAQWKTFPLLAIAANRGPIFTATLVPGKGGVTAATASGVWATDFNDATRLLFRTGDMIGGKTLKSFTLLNASVGSLGVTRSFNNDAEVVWLATFTDKTTAIIRTTVP